MGKVHPRQESENVNKCISSESQSSQSGRLLSPLTFPSTLLAQQVVAAMSSP